MHILYSRHTRFHARLIITITFFQLFFLNNLLTAGQRFAVIEKLHQEHPRLILTKNVQERIENLAEDDLFLQKLIQTLFILSEQMLVESTVQYKLEGPRLLYQSRDCLSKVMFLALTYRLSGEVKFARRAILEMQAAAEFPDWNPSHFLDVAEMSAALAIGYDWLFNVLSDQEKMIIKSALVEKGLKPGLKQYPTGFARKVNNWNFVCNGGMIMAALAIADEEPQLAEEIIQKAFTSLPLALEKYAPDGAWFEGPSYWMYGTNYLTMLFSALKSALGTDFNFPDYQGLDQTGYFFLSSIGPSGEFFNYSDCRLRPQGSTPVLFWLGRHYEQPFYAHHARQMLSSYFETLNVRNFGKSGENFHYRFFPLEIIWYDQREKSSESILPLDAFYRGPTDLIFLRSSWETDALFLGFKGGNDAVNHSHLDYGSFIFEANGQRWAEDFGSDEYNLPGYFEYKSEGRRWNYFRNSSLSHNIVTINNHNQHVGARVKMIAFLSEPERAHAVADLTKAYEGQAARVLRGIAMLNREQLLIQDEVVGLQDNDLFRWAMLTSADVELNGHQATLSKGDQLLSVDIVQPADARFVIDSTRPSYHPDEKPNTGTRLLTVVIPVHAGKITSLAIRLTPLGAKKQKIPSQSAKIIPLINWDGYLN